MKKVILALLVLHTLMAPINGAENADAKITPRGFYMVNESKSEINIILYWNKEAGEPINNQVISLPGLHSLFIANKQPILISTLRKISSFSSYETVKFFRAKGLSYCFTNQTTCKQEIPSLQSLCISTLVKQPTESLLESLKQSKGLAREIEVLLNPQQETTTPEEYITMTSDSFYYP